LQIQDVFSIFITLIFDATSVPDDDTIVRVASGGVDCMVRIWFIRKIVGDNILKNQIFKNHKLKK
jgi:hypothetical protein